MPEALEYETSAQETTIATSDATTAEMPVAQADDGIPYKGKKRQEFGNLLGVLQTDRRFDMEARPNRKGMTEFYRDAFLRLIELSPKKAAELLEGKTIRVKPDPHSLMYQLLKDASDRHGTVHLAENVFRVNNPTKREPTVKKIHKLKGNLDRLETALKATKAKKAKMHVHASVSMLVKMEHEDLHRLRHLLTEYRDVLHPMEWQSIFLHAENFDTGHNEKTVIEPTPVHYQQGGTEIHETDLVPQEQVQALKGALHQMQS
jgi:hypothetical protein